ncbi:MAG: hypothetical protein R6W69_04440, partial [Anaerolineales bacterium]
TVWKKVSRIDNRVPDFDLKRWHQLCLLGIPVKSPRILGYQRARTRADTPKYGLLCGKYQKTLINTDNLI